nr:zinc finger, CCHC-type, retrotransposon Gag domain protein [Tanacetum cinerariifolium]
DMTSDVSPIHEQPIVLEFLDLFPDELPGIPPVREAKNFQWGLRRSTLNHLMCISYTDVAQVANAARNYEILHERDDGDTDGNRHHPTSQQSSHRSHGQNNDRHGSDRRGGSDNHRSSNNNYSGNNNRNFDNGRDQRNRGQQSNQSANSGFQQSRGPSEGYSYLVCTMCGRRHPGEYRRAAGICFKCG